MASLALRRQTQAKRACARQSSQLGATCVPGKTDGSWLHVHYPVAHTAREGVLPHDGQLVGGIYVHGARVVWPREGRLQGSRLGSERLWQAGWPVLGI